MQEVWVCPYCRAHGLTCPDYHTDPSAISRRSEEILWKSVLCGVVSCVLLSEISLLVMQMAAAELSAVARKILLASVGLAGMFFATVLTSRFLVLRDFPAERRREM